MPISANRFDEIDDDSDGPAPGTNAHEVFAFLEANPDKAFTRGELIEATGVKPGSIGPTLVRLREHGRVDHKGRYWRISDHVRSLTEAARHADATAARHEETEFDREAWSEHATDPRADRE